VVIESSWKRESLDSRWVVPLPGGGGLLAGPSERVLLLFPLEVILDRRYSTWGSRKHDTEYVKFKNIKTCI
jgi:hypothetical protein